MDSDLHSPPNGCAAAQTASGTVSVPIVQEEARIERREVEGDRVRVTTHTELVEEHVRETLQSDDVEVMRVPVNRTLEPGEAAPATRTEGDVTIIPILEEVLVVEKRLVLREELHILRESSAEEVEVPVTLRRQRAAIERIGPEGSIALDNED
jgi:stress response protein YsnF